MRGQKLILGVALILLVTISTSGTNGYSEIEDAIKIEPVSIRSPSDSSDLSVTWTSREHTAPQPLENSSVITGDHVILNATFSENPSFGNITRSRMHIWDGILFESTQPLVNFTNIFPDGVIDADGLSWVIIQGFEIGDLVSITCNFTNSDCDFFAWDGLTEPQEYYYANNLLRMATNNTPESYSFIWTSTNDTMQLGCMNFDEAPSGNWTVYLEAGIHFVAENTGISEELDTYYVHNEAQSYDLIVAAYNELNETIEYLWEDIEICNFYEPELSAVNVIEMSELVFNFTWSCTDTNADDTNYFAVFLSNNDGASYMMLTQNTTRTFYIWNSTGWLEGYYVVRIRAYSVDYSSPECSLDDPPNSYWSGDFSDVITPQFLAGNVQEHLDVYPLEITISEISDCSYQYGSTGNMITLTIHYMCWGSPTIEYSLQINDSTWCHGYSTLDTSPTELAFSIDGLEVGRYFALLSIDSFQKLSRSFVIDVVDSTTQTVLPGTDWNTAFHYLAIGISAGSIVIIGIVVILSVRLKKNQVVEYV